MSLSRAVLYHIYNIGAKWREANHLSTRRVAVSLYRSTLRRSLPVGGKHRAGRPLPSVYLNFQHPRCTPHSVTTWAVVSYTHLLTLTHRPFLREREGSDGRLFSSALLSSRELLPVKKRITLCCPDFPLSVILTAAIGCPTIH